MEFLDNFDIGDGFGVAEGLIPGFEGLEGEEPPKDVPSTHDVTLEPLDVTLTAKDDGKPIENERIDYDDDDDTEIDIDMDVPTPAPAPVVPCKFHIYV